MQSQKTLKASHDTAMAKVDELMGQLKEERFRSLGLENQLQTKALQERRASEVLLNAQSRVGGLRSGTAASSSTSQYIF